MSDVTQLLRALDAGDRRTADLSESPVPPGFDLGTPYVDLAPNLFARYEQTNLLRVMELGIGWSEVFHEPVGPDLENVLCTDLLAVRGGKQPLPPEQPPRAFNEDAGLFGIYDVTVSPDGRWTSVRKRLDEIVVYDAVAMERSSVVQPAAQQVFSSAFSPDSRRLATGAGGRETVQLWQVGTGRELLTLPGTGRAFFMQFAEDGNTLLAGSPARGTWQMWRAPSWEVIHAAEAKDAPSSTPGGAERAESRKPWKGPAAVAADGRTHHPDSLRPSCEPGLWGPLGGGQRLVPSSVHGLDSRPDLGGPVDPCRSRSNSCFSGIQ